MWSRQRLRTLRTRRWSKASESTAHRGFDVVGGNVVGIGPPAVPAHRPSGRPVGVSRAARIPREARREFGFVRVPPVWRRLRRRVGADRRSSDRWESSRPRERHRELDPELAARRLRRDSRLGAQVVLWRPASCGSEHHRCGGRTTDGCDEPRNPALSAPVPRERSAGDASGGHSPRGAAERLAATIFGSQLSVGFQDVGGGVEPAAFGQSGRDSVGSSARLGNALPRKAFRFSSARRRRVPSGTRRARTRRNRSTRSLRRSGRSWRFGSLSGGPGGLSSDGRAARSSDSRSWDGE